MNNQINLTDIFNISFMTELKRMEEKGDAALIVSLINNYFKSSTELVNNIESMFQEKKFRNLEYCIHSLKSSSNLLGLERLAEACRELEAKAQKGNAIKEDLVELKKIHKSSIEALKTYLK